MQGNQLLSVRTYLTQKIQRSPRKTPNKTDILKVMQAASCTHYANFYDVLEKITIELMLNISLKMLSRTGRVVKEDICTPVVPLTS